MQAARYSSMSCTVMRVPRPHGVAHPRNSVERLRRRTPLHPAPRLRLGAKDGRVVHARVGELFVSTDVAKLAKAADEKSWSQSSASPSNVTRSTSGLRIEHACSNLNRESICRRNKLIALPCDETAIDPDVLPKGGPVRHAVVGERPFAQVVDVIQLEPRVPRERADRVEAASVRARVHLLDAEPLQHGDERRGLLVTFRCERPGLVAERRVVQRLSVANEIDHFHAIASATSEHDGIMRP